MVKSGFIMLYRGLNEWEWYTDVNVCKLFLHCLLKVNYSQKRWQGILIEKGEFITSYEKLAVETGLTVSKVRTALSKLTSTNDVCIATTKSYTKVCIPKFTDFVVDSKRPKNDIPTNTQFDTPNSIQIATKSQSDSKQIATTNTNNKLIKNRKKIFRDKVFGHSNFNPKILKSFFNYWSELNVKENRMRFESHEFFEIEKRIEKWMQNEKSQFGDNLSKTTESNR
jgi:hypothetical protein